jgi:hypothetical protein
MDRRRFVKLISGTTAALGLFSRDMPHSTEHWMRKKQAAFEIADDAKKYRTLARLQFEAQQRDCLRNSPIINLTPPGENDAL